ncbi:Ubiquitin carboxyl-terminal hydrolase 44 [Oryzias melastigma]|uniref:ubiquitinyl hydrolase 1 n=1 Tax=Oryzias melastigma TaxID=30732 RepID=A0A834FLK8_ORYME|nr:Ubiquitin carboxyl-terminal hydrolase 44 [Oryzias melastigma]
MDRCKHVGRLRLSQDHSILNPQKWHCVECSTTDSVWACLKCSHVACGRFMEEHSLKHFQESQHPLAMEVRELDVFCFACGDYVLNDNAEGDLKLLRGALSTVPDPGPALAALLDGRGLRAPAGHAAGPAPPEEGAPRKDAPDVDRQTPGPPEPAPGEAGGGQEAEEGGETQADGGARQHSSQKERPASHSGAPLHHHAHSSQVPRPPRTPTSSSS